MKIDVVVPNYNGFDLIEKNLPILIDVFSDYKGSRIIIVDDNSSEEEFVRLREFIEKVKRELFHNIKLLRNEKNLGFSSTVNKGVRESNADLVVLLNTDVVPEKRFLDSIINDFASDKNLFGAGCMDKSIEDGKTVLRGRGVAFWEKGLLVHRRGEVDKTDTFWISGGSSVVRRDLFKELGGFDEIYNPFYWEDIDMSYRARKSGYEVKFNPKSIVEHSHSKGAIKKHYGNFEVKIIAYRNQFIFIWKNITDPAFLTSHLLWLPYHILISIFRFDVPMLLGFFFALARLPAIIEKRSEQRKLYKRGDQDLLQTS